MNALKTFKITLGFGLAIIAFVLIAVPTLWNPTGIPLYFGEYVANFTEASERAAFAASLVAAGPATEIVVPVVGVEATEIADTYGAPRGADRRHEGIDIFAPRGTYIVSATEGIVARIGENRLGGTIVFVLGPGGERYYYAHLDSVDPMLTIGQRVGTSTILGRVGTTGNAAGTPPHLHFGIYGNGGARNPYERLR